MKGINEWWVFTRSIFHIFSSRGVFTVLLSFGKVDSHKEEPWDGRTEHCSSASLLSAGVSTATSVLAMGDFMSAGKKGNDGMKNTGNWVLLYWDNDGGGFSEVFAG